MEQIVLFFYPPLDKLLNLVNEVIKNCESLWNGPKVIGCPQMENCEGFKLYPSNLSASKAFTPSSLSCFTTHLEEAGRNVNHSYLQTKKNNSIQWRAIDFPWFFMERDSFASICELTRSFLIDLPKCSWLWILFWNSYNILLV